MTRLSFQLWVFRLARDPLNIPQINFPFIDLFYFKAVRKIDSRRSILST